MGIVQRFLEGATIEPLKRLLEVLSLGPGDVCVALGVITVIFFVNEFLKTYLVIEHTRSAIIHILINILTLLPAVVLVVVLVYAGYRHPERAWSNVGFVLITFIPWYMFGKLTRLARNDVEGAGTGFMAVGLLLVLFAGVATAVIF